MGYMTMQRLLEVQNDGSIKVKKLIPVMLVQQGRDYRQFTDVLRVPGLEK